MNVIFGAGVVGLIARHVLVGNWQIVPFGRSRFFSFNPPLDDNFMISGGVFTKESSEGSPSEDIVGCSPTNESNEGSLAILMCS